MISDFKREYGRVKHLSVNELSKKFAEIQLVPIVLLFGSRAENSENAGSDYDFAVIIDDSADTGWGKISAIRNQIGSLLDLPDCDFDVVDLEKADENLLSSILKTHVILKGDKNAVSRLLGKHKNIGKD